MVVVLWQVGSGGRITEDEDARHGGWAAARTGRSSPGLGTDGHAHLPFLWRPGRRVCRPGAPPPVGCSDTRPVAAVLSRVRWGSNSSQRDSVWERAHSRFGGSGLEKAHLTLGRWRPRGHSSLRGRLGNRVQRCDQEEGKRICWTDGHVRPTPAGPRDTAC